MNFTERLRTTQQTKNSLLCIGLDVDPAQIPEHLQKTQNPVLEFCREIVSSTFEFSCAYKSNLAFFESLGLDGWRTLYEVRKLIPSNVVCIADGKRGDIGNSSARYVKALFDDFGFDAATVNPYMGYDSLEPFLNYKDKGVFILALTSNPDSANFQRRIVDGHPLFEEVINEFASKDKHHNTGFVVGATHPNDLKRVRSLAPDAPLLIPGVGAQGGDLRSSVIDGTDKNGELAIINASRSIIYASKGADFADAARREAKRLRNEMLKFKAEKTK